MFATGKQQQKPALTRVNFWLLKSDDLRTGYRCAAQLQSN
jgi:hypothetical protein